MCNDPLIKGFRQLGFNVVRLPSGSFAPLLLLESDGRRRVRVVGRLQDDLPPQTGQPFPKVRRSVPVANITTRSSAATTGKLALGIVEPLLSSLGLEPRFGAALGRSRDVKVVLQNIQRDGVLLSDLDRYLAAGVVDPTRSLYDAARGGRLFIVTTTLKSSSFSIAAGRGTLESLTPLALGSELIQGSADAARVQAREDRLDFKGVRPVTFAFSAVRLRHESDDFFLGKAVSGYSGFELAADVGLYDDLLLDADASRPFDEPNSPRTS